MTSPEDYLVLPGCCYAIFSFQKLAILSAFGLLVLVFINSQEFLDSYSRHYHEQGLNFFCSNVYLTPSGLKVICLDGNRGVEWLCLPVVT